jgi:hypothetical protein
VVSPTGTNPFSGNDAGKPSNEVLLMPATSNIVVCMAFLKLLLVTASTTMPRMAKPMLE